MCGPVRSKVEIMIEIVEIEKGELLISKLLYFTSKLVITFIFCPQESIQNPQIAVWLVSIGECTIDCCLILLDGNCYGRDLCIVCPAIIAHFPQQKGYNSAGGSGACVPTCSPLPCPAQMGSDLLIPNC